MTHCVPNGPFPTPFRPPSITYNPLPPAESQLDVVSPGVEPGCQLSATVSQLRQVHPRLSTAQLGNLIMNQSNQPATYNHVQALRPSYQSAPFEKRALT